MKKNNILCIKFNRVKGFYSVDKVLGHEIDNLAFFLTDDVVNDPDWWLRFLDNPKEDMMIGDMQELDKEGDKVFIGCQFRQGNEDRDPYAFETTISELKRIIKEWVKLYNQQSEFIILKYENGKVTFETE